MKARYIPAFFIILALVLACAKPPLADMESAREAVFRAENDENAARFAGSSLARARDALKLMESEADSKRYDAAKTHAMEAIAAAEKAIADGQAASVRARDEAASLLSSLKPEIEETSRNVNGARYSQLNLDFDQLDREISGAYNKADQAERDQAQGRYQDAIDTAMGVRSDLYGINQRISNAVTRRK
jgi:vacuolar-type H+-ATPase subunit D/Vma8